MATRVPNYNLLEIRELHSNAVHCIGCQIHDDPGKYDVTIAKSELSRHLQKHVDALEKYWADQMDNPSLCRQCFFPYTHSNLDDGFCSDGCVQEYNRQLTGTEDDDSFL